MPAPTVAWQLITVTGHFRNFEGAELTGTVTFEPTVRAVDYVNDIIVLPTAMQATVAAGILLGPGATPGIVLPATNDPDITPTGWTYKVTETISGQPASYVYNITVPYDSPGATVDLADLIPVDPGGSGVVYSAAYQMRVEKDAALGYLGLDAGGLVPNARLDVDLAAIGGLTPTNDDLIQRKSGAWINRTPAQLKTDLVLTAADVGLGNVDNTSNATERAATATLTNKTINGASNTITIAEASVTGLVADLAARQPLDTDLTDIAALTPTNNDVVQRKSGAWINRTPAQLKTDLVLVAGDVGLGNVDNTSNATERAATATLTNKTISGSSNTLTNIAESSVTNLVSDLAAKQPLDADLTAIAGLSGVADDLLQYKSGAWANRTLAQVKSDLALNNVDNTSNATERAATATLTNKTLTSPVINTPTGIVKGDVGLGNVDNTSNATERAATATLTNKTISGSSNTLSNIAESSVTNLTTDLAAKLAIASNLSDVANAATARTNLAVPSTSRLLTAGVGLTGGGDLSADRTFTVVSRGRYGEALTAGGEFTRERNCFRNSGQPQTSGRMQLTYFVATVTESINTITIYTSGTAAATITLIRYGVYTVAGNGDITLINSTVNDTSLLAATFTNYPKALSSTWSKVAGTVYAVAHLIVGTTMPTLYSDTTEGSSLANAIRLEEPRYSGYVDSLSDLSSSTVNASILASRQNAFQKVS